MNILKKTIIFYLLFLGSVNSIWATHNIFVLDTSKSVTNNSSYSIMVETIKVIASKFAKDNEISFFTFDEDFNSLIDKQVVPEEKFNEILDTILVDGSWTYTSLMLSQLVNRLKNEKAVNLFIFSDGIDDPPLNQFTDFDTYQNNESNLFYFYYRRNSNKQKKLIQSAFPDIYIKRFNANSQKEIESIIDEVIPRVEIEIISGLEGELKTGKKSEFIININSNKVAEGKEALLYVGVDKNIFNITPKIQNRFYLQEGINNFVFPYQIKNSFQNEAIKLLINVSLAESPEYSLDSKNIAIKIAELPFYEKLYKLPIYAIPLLIIFLFILFIIYRFVCYLLFVPVVRMSYRLIKDDETLMVNTVDLGTLKSGNYHISSSPDAFLVLPELSDFSVLSLVKKGKKYQTRVLIHRHSLRNISDENGRIIRKRGIKNGTNFYLENYHFTFQTNI